MNAVDTNVLIYARATRDPRKLQVAMTLIAELEEPVLLWQVACEYMWASRKLEHLGYSRVKAFADISFLRDVWSTAVPAWKTFDLAEVLRLRYSLSFWDSLIAAACLDSGVTTLYSEDFDHGTKIETLRVVNPFA